MTVMDVFYRYLIAYSTSSQDVEAIAKVIVNMLTKHAYLQTTINSDEGSVFMSQVNKEVAEVLGINVEHATTKHAQTMGLLERTHASLKKALKLETGERRSMWHKHVSIAVLNNNTSYHTSVGCEQSRVFHGPVPYNAVDLKLSICPQKTPTSKSQFAENVFKQTEVIFQDVPRNSIPANIRYKG